jgi:hypothetical protein
MHETLRDESVFTSPSETPARFSQEKSGHGGKVWHFLPLPGFQSAIGAKARAKKNPP